VATIWALPVDEWCALAKANLACVPQNLICAEHLETNVVRLLDAIDQDDESLRDPPLLDAHDGELELVPLAAHDDVAS